MKKTLAMGSFLIVALAAIVAAQTVSQGQLSLNQPRDAQLMSGQEHLYTFQLGSSAEVTITMDRTDSSGIDPYIQLRDSNGNEIAYDDDGGSGFNSRLVRQLNAGSYQVLAREFGRNDTGMYRILVSSGGGAVTTPAPTPTPAPAPAPSMPGSIPIAVGQTITSYINVGQEQSFSFTVGSAQSIQIDVESVDGAIDSYLELYEQSGREIATNDDGGSGFNSRLVRDLQPGSYRFVARDLGNNSAGSLRVTVQSRGQAQVASGPIPINIGQRLTANLVAGNEQVFVLQVPSTQQLQIDFESLDGEIDPYLVIEDQFGNEVASNDDGPRGLDSRIVTSLNPGSYRVIGSDLWGDRGGQIALSVQQAQAVSAAQGIPITVGQSIDSYINEGQELSLILTISETQEVQIDVEATNNSGIDSYLILNDQFGSRIDSNDDGGSGFNSRLRRTLQPGTYQILASDLGDNTAGSLRVTVSSGAMANLIPITPGQAYDQFLQSGQEIGYDLTVNQRGLIVIEMNRTGQPGLDPYLELYGPGGQQIAADDDTGGNLNSRITQLLEPGRYRIIARDVFGSGSGSFRMSVRTEGVGR